MQIGDTVVYPPHGVVNIQKISSKFGGVYSFKSSINPDVQLSVPVSRANEIMRPLSSNDIVFTAWEVLKDKTSKTVLYASWSKRYKDLTNKINTGSLIEIADAIKTSKRHDNLASYGERQLLKLAIDIFASEVSLIENRSVNSIIMDINSIQY
jgi:CarD family transcriptional regulator